MESYITAFITPVLTALVVWFIERARMKKEDEREEIEMVNREVNNATMELAYATSVAVEKGKTNGELRLARKAYSDAVKHRDELGQKLMSKK